MKILESIKTTFDGEFFNLKFDAKILIIILVFFWYEISEIKSLVKTATDATGLNTAALEKISQNQKQLSSAISAMESNVQTDRQAILEKLRLSEKEIGAELKSFEQRSIERYIAAMERSTAAKADTMLIGNRLKELWKICKRAFEKAGIPWRDGESENSQKSDQ